MNLVSLVAYVAIYVIMMTTVMHTVFTLINWVPNNVLRWIGGSLQAYGVGDQEGHEMKTNVAAFIERGRGHMVPKRKNPPQPSPAPPPPGDTPSLDNKGSDFPTNEVR